MARAPSTWLSMNDRVRRVVHVVMVGLVDDDTRRQWKLRKKRFEVATPRQRARRIVRVADVDEAGLSTSAREHRLEIV
jgi:hypothetical protein